MDRLINAAATRASAAVLAIASLLIPAFAAAADGGGDSAVRAAERTPLPPNTWVRVEAKYLSRESGGQHTPAQWNKLVYDSVGKRMIYLDRWSDPLRGQTIYANAVLAFDAAAHTVACLKVSNWKRLSHPSGGYNTVPLPENERDPTPCDRHPYGSVAFVPHQNAVYLGGGANQSARGGHPDDTWRFDLAANKWSLVESELTPPDHLEAAMEYDPAHRVIVRVCESGASTWLLDVERGQWRNAEAKNNPRCGMSAAMVYDSARGRMLLFGGPGRAGTRWNEAGPEVYAYSVAENEWTRLPDAPVAARAPGMAYDARRDLVLIHVVGRTQEPATAIYLPGENRWRTIRLKNEGPVRDVSWHTLAYDSENDFFVRAAGPYNDPQWWLLRLDLAELPRD